MRIDCAAQSIEPLRGPDATNLVPRVVRGRDDRPA